MSLVFSHTSPNAINFWGVKSVLQALHLNGTSIAYRDGFFFLFKLFFPSKVMLKKESIGLDTSTCPIFLPLPVGMDRF
jgi:hypothetical protein